MKSRNILSIQFTLYAQMWIYQLIGLCIFAIARVVHLWRHVSLSSLMELHAESVPLFLWNSWRFDIQAVTYISLPIIVGLLIVPYLKQKTIEKFKSFMLWYYAVMLTILAGIVVAEFFFYRNFNSRYNIVFFDFFDEGPLELLQTMWQDYPFLGILVALLAVATLILVAGRGIRRMSAGKGWQTKVWHIVATSIAIAGITFVFMRGSVTRYTLQVEAFMVSTSEGVNQAVPNAIYLLKKAYKERNNSFRLYTDEEMLRQEGFATLDEAIVAAGFPIVQAESDEAKLTKTLFSCHGEDCCMSEKKQPNVLIVLNESWSRFLLEMDKGEHLDLLCSLRKHLKEDMLFTNIQSVRNGTIYSLEALTLAMPYPHFFNSRYRFEHLPTSIAHPFKEDGYSTAFITGMDPTWENVQEGLLHQSFDTIIGRQNILRSIHGSTTSAIGVYDEFLYQYIQRFMEDKTDGKPKFIIALTTTNHPPFTYPEDMKLPPLNEEWYDSPYLTGDREVLQKYGLGTQYANQSLGDFLTEFKHSPVSDNTIILVTGDHNVRSILDYEKVAKEYVYAVPMYLYLPQAYRINKEKECDITQRYGSHFDILPTLAPMCLNEGTAYLAIGQNLLDTNRCSSSYYSYNERQLLAPDEGDQDSLMKIMKTRELLMKIYYQQRFRAGGQ